MSIAVEPQAHSRLHTLIAIICVVVFFFVSSFNYAFASHRYRLNTSSLDDDPVETFPIPVLFGVELDDVHPDFGDPRGGGTREHEGQDFRAPLGTPIVSPTEAIVLRTGTGDSAGKYVYTANPGGEVFRYMHLDYIADLDRGDELDVGDFIGAVGDTGNAPDGVYHLHFETRDKDNDAQDPYPRLEDGFTLKEKVSFLADIFRDIRDDEEYAAFLVETFESDFKEALNKGYNLPDDIEDALEDAGIISTASLQKQLDALLATIPKLLTAELKNGDTGNAVVLLQLYLIYTTDGPAQQALAGASATGYYGTLTQAAVLAYQEKHDVPETGIYDKETRSSMMK